MWTGENDGSVEEVENEGAWEGESEEVRMGVDGEVCMWKGENDGSVDEGGSRMRVHGGRE